ncbi:MAG TPA: hypothetical protein VMN56_09520 [Casimicrobiaceae bacterium]|nr:hypothetical protein [Casimicrobiaceae bacterium]
MNHTTTHYRHSKRERALRPVFGALAALAAVATLGLTVVGPACIPREAALAPVDVVAYRNQAPTEVAIAPASIHVVAQRTRTARAGNPYMPTSYRSR